MENEKKLLVEITTKAYIDEDDCIVTESSVEGKCTLKMFLTVLCQSFWQLAKSQGISGKAFLTIIGTVLADNEDDDEEE